MNSFVAEISRLRSMTTRELRDRYIEVFGEQSRSRNKDYLWKRIAYRIQEQAEGGLSERVRQRAQELACDADLRVRGNRVAVPEPKPSPKKMAPAEAKKRDPRIPPAGTIIIRHFGGTDHVVRVLNHGFEYRGERYRSLSAVAIKISGTKCSGFNFFAEALANGGTR
jgi:hypothetical protein